ncbi:syndecan-2 [Fundulus heteroclitus]|uniref:syndecan-2 n=1 Tax=Fundulus heteroclitus TaxID=8078 RepID=UPI00165BD06E|nr:syndecan-2 [Fundulus heteroclitus]
MKNLWLFFVVGLSTGFIGGKLSVLSQSTKALAEDLYIDEPGSGDLPVDDDDDDDGGSGSGSGSGDYGLSIFSDRANKEVTRGPTVSAGLNRRFGQQPRPAQTTAGSAPSPTATAADQQDPANTAGDTESPFSDDGNMFVQVLDPMTNWDDKPLSTSATPVAVTTDLSDYDDDEYGVGVTEAVIKKEVFPNNKQGSSRYGLNSPQEVTSENLWERTEVLAAVIACGVVGFLCAVSLLFLLAYRMKKKDEGSYDLGDSKLSATAYQKAPTKEFFA